MNEALNLRVPENRWNDADVDGLSEPEQLLYRSNLLGSDLAITNSAAATRRPRSSKPTR